MFDNGAVEKIGGPAEKAGASFSLIAYLQHPSFSHKGDSESAMLLFIDHMGILLGEFIRLRQ